MRLASQSSLLRANFGRLAACKPARHSVSCTAFTGGATQPASKMHDHAPSRAGLQRERLSAVKAYVAPGCAAACPSMDMDA